MLAKELIDKYIAGKCTAEERAIVELWFDKELNNTHASVQPSQQRLESIKNTMPWMAKQKIRSVNFRWVAAACLLLAMSVSMYIWQYSKGSFDPNAELFTKRASVLLPNGEHVILDKTFDPNDSILLSQNGLTVSVDGVIRLSRGELSDSEQVETLTRIETPRGGEYKVELSDGTLVQLNSQSSLEFPTHFLNRERRVKLQGEAYFDVAKNKERPFIINAADKMGIQVLGTSFNVSTYANKVFTTLIEGSVLVNNLSQNQMMAVIKPGETASMGNTGQIQIENTDLEKAVAWKNGLFNFNNSTVAEVADELERWYDIQVLVDPYVAHVKLYGEFERKQPLANAVKLLEAVGIKVKLEGREMKLYEKK